MGIKRILEAIFESDFRDSSYGFRPNRSCHEALDVLDKTIMTKPVNVVVDMDIERFYDTIDHTWLMECLMQRINDSSLLRLIARFLKAGIIEEGKYYEADKGTVQGDIMSPTLANIYLHFVLNLWFERVAQKQLKGFAKLITYADDFVVCFESKESAEQFGEMLKQRLAKFGLKIAEDKGRVIEFGRSVWEKVKREGGKVATFDFLGFTHFCDKTRKGKFKLGRKTSSKKFRQKMIAVNDWLRKVRNRVKREEWWKVLKRKIVGHYQYYGISGNLRSLQKFHYLTLRLVWKWLNRRSQKKSYSYKAFCRYLGVTLPQPKIYHLSYALSSV
jgi:group II intron reverse transcriptase/maturase